MYRSLAKYVHLFTYTAHQVSCKTASILSAAMSSLIMPLLITRAARQNGWIMFPLPGQWQGPGSKLATVVCSSMATKEHCLCRWTTRWLVLHKAALIASTGTAIIVLGKLGSPDNSTHIMVMSAGAARATTMRSNCPTVGILVMSLYDDAQQKPWLLGSRDQEKARVEVLDPTAATSVAGKQ